MKLPDIFQNKIEENLKNSMEVFYSSQKEVTILDDFPFFAHIQTKNQSFKIKIIGNTTNYLVTANGKMIYLKDCLSIKKI